MKQLDGKTETSCIFVNELENNDDMRKIPPIDETQFKDNPYTYELTIPVTKLISDIEYAENVDGILVNKAFYLEQTKKVELYIHESSGANVAALSDRAQRLFLHLLYTMKKNKDYVYINRQYYMKRNNVKSQTTFNAAVKELHRYQFIQPTHEKGWFWINPHRFFPGNRVNKYPDKIKVVTTWDKTE